MINVLFIGMTSNFGGMETYMINIFSILIHQGFHFDFINMQSNPIAYSNYIKKNGGKIYNVNIEDSKIPHLTRMHKANSFFSSHHNYDIIHLNTTYLNQIYWLKAAKRHNIKHLIIQSHNSNMDYRSLLFKYCNKILGWINKKYLFFHPSIKLLAASENCGKWMFGNNSKFEIIKNGVNTKNYIPNIKIRLTLRKKLGINAKDKVIITTSRLEKQKNYPKIIRIFKYVHMQNKLTKLVIIGSGSLKSEIKKLIRNCNLDDSIYLLGQLNKTKVDKLLNIADLMLMPSLYEGLPFSLVESQAAGIPSLVSLEAVPKEVNITGKIKYLSIYKSDKLWADMAINILKNNPYNIYNKLKMNNKISKSCYGIKYSSNQIRHYYLSLINNRV